jgi:hypothetical protein
MAYMITAVSAFALLCVWHLPFRRRYDALIPSPAGMRSLKSQKDSGCQSR